MTRIRSLLLCALLCFCTALLACLAQYGMSAARGETNIVLIFDSGHYRDTAVMLVAALKTGLAAFAQKQELARAMILDGPVLPGLAALSFFCLNDSLSLKDWQCLLLLQSFLHALSAALVFLLVRQSNPPSWKWPLAAGLLWAINPIAVLASQRFLAETFSADLLLLLLLGCCRLARSRGRALVVSCLAGGLLLGLILFAKTALMPVAIITFVLSIFASLKQAVKERSDRPLVISYAAAALAAVFGLALTIAPWAAFTGTLTGKSSYFPERMPAFNLLVSWNFEESGLSTLPLSPPSPELASAYDHTDSAPQAVLALWLKEPGRSAALGLEKFGRLYGLPWNDFRRISLGLSPKLQRVEHQFVLILALLAVCAGVCRGAPFSFWLTALLAAGHLIFVLFEAVPRYSFSSYPLIFLLAAQALQWMRKPWVKDLLITAGLLLLTCIDLPLAAIAMHPSQERYLSLALLVVAVALILALFLGRYLSFEFISGQKLRFSFALGMVALLCGLVQVAWAMDSPERGEWQAKLGPGQAAERVFELPDKAAPGFAYVVIDAVKQVGDCTVQVNGTLLKDKPVNLYSFMPDRNIHFYFAEQVAAFMGRTAADIRHWWAVPVPLELLRCGQKNSIALLVPAAASVRLYGEGGPRQGACRRPGYLFVSPGRAWITNDSFEWREGPSLGSIDCAGESSLVAGGERKLQPGNLRLFMLTGGPDESPQTAAKALETGRFKVY